MSRQKKLKKTLIVGCSCPKCRAVESLIAKEQLTDEFTIIEYESHRDEVEKLAPNAKSLPILIDNGLVIDNFGDVLRTVRNMI